MSEQELRRKNEVQREAMRDFAKMVRENVCVPFSNNHINSIFAALYGRAFGKNWKRASTLGQRAKLKGIEIMFLTSAHGKKMFDWITEKLDAGFTVWISTVYQHTYLKPSHKDRIRYNKPHCEIMRGKHWDSINGCKITARME